MQEVIRELHNFLYIVETKSNLSRATIISMMLTNGHTAMTVSDEQVYSYLNKYDVLITEETVGWDKMYIITLVEV